jgi:hypothetical protein
MPLEYLDEIVRTSRTGDLSEFVNLSFGAGDDAGNTFELFRRLRQSRPMQRREPVPPHCLDSLLQLPKRTLGRSLAEIARALNYDLNFYPKPDFFFTHWKRTPMM